MYVYIFWTVNRNERGGISMRMLFFMVLGLSIVFPYFAFANSESLPWSMWHPMMFGFPGGIFMMLIIIVGIVILLVLLFKKEPTSHLVSSTHEAALDILKRRYARGEISREEFEQMRRDIEE